MDIAHWFHSNDTIELNFEERGCSDDHESIEYSRYFRRLCCSLSCY